ncbi:MAG TPA: DNA polymerase/3'-5' exonuclease PolX [Gaiellaceae bacterium]|nr:DNA polymerase/3'-5' exonuclease PolX [Gaiellaceae bacterium]
MAARIIASTMAPLPANADVAAQFELLADIFELEGMESFRVLAYRRAATRIRETGTSVAQLALDGKAKELQGIGKTIEEKIVQIVEDGEVHALTKHKQLVPADVVEFMRIPGLGPKTARRIWHELGITTLEGLKEAAGAERLRTLSGLGPRSEENVLRALSEKRDTGPARALLGVALPAVLAAVEELRAHPAAREVCEAGSVRRRRESVRDVDIIATARDAGALIAHFTELPWVVEVAARGGTKATVVSGHGLRFDLRVVPPECYGNLLQHFTGSKGHNIAMREEAQRRGLSISEYGVLVTETGETVTHRNERQLYEFLGYELIPPELRENAGELEAARAGSLPKLVELRQLKGDLHSHTTWSADGHNTIEEMALAAIARGYEYLAITDHSHYLREGRMEAQDAEIDGLNEQLTPFRLLKGVEANIRADGSLDVPDEVLAGREWVVASLHSAFQRDPTERVCGAMESPHVDCIGHLTARKIGRRGGAAIDPGRVIETAARTGTALEINSQPDRLDMPDPLARLAGEEGVLVPVTSDAHRVSTLAYVELGIGQARRAWLTKKQVLNTRSWPQIEKTLKR